MPSYAHSAHPGHGLVVPLERRQTVAGHGRERVDEVRAEMQRDVAWQEAAARRTILRPVGVVANPPPVCGRRRRRRPHRLLVATSTDS